jgi:hypothetical protein
MQTGRSLPFRLQSIGLIIVIGLALSVYGRSAARGIESGAAAASSQVTKSGSRKPTLAKDFKPAKPVTVATYKAISDQLYSMRRALAARGKQATSPGALPPATADPTEPEAGTRFHGTPNAFTIGRNSFNDRADDNTCGTGNTLAEPAAANEGGHVYYTGNTTHQEFSINGGATWTCAAAYPAGPAEAPTPFGDTDVIYDHSRGVTFHSVLYVAFTGGTVTNGIIRLFVRNNINQADNCFYDIDTDPGATNVLDDYPHLGLSNNFLYISANRVQRPAGPWLGAYMERDNLDQLVDCGFVNFNFINFTNNSDQRILVPGHGARDVMYFAWVNTTSQWRVFSWADNSGTVFDNLLNVGTMTFGDPDCRGGTNNADWADNLAFQITGFNVRTTVGNDFVSVWAPTAADTAHTQAHVHGAVFRIGTSQTDLSLVQQPVVFNTTNCVGIPIPGVNDRGDIGMAIAFGSRAGGGGTAVGTVVLMKDEFTPGPGGFSAAFVATGTHNPTRFGDYFTVRRDAPCGEWFDATAYALSGGTALANVNARYVEFGRGRDAQCYFAWANAIPAT